MKEIIPANHLTEHMNLSYSIIKDSVNLISLDRSLFNGTIIESKQISNCHIQFSEWTGTKVNSSTIISCNLNHSEIKSAWFKNVTFINIIFDEALISDTTFSNCSFIKCRITGTLFQENYFVNCNFENNDFTPASVNMCIFKKCIFSGSNIGGSFYYSVFEKCELLNCDIDQYLLGYILGVFDSTLDNVRYIKRDHVCNNSFDEMIEDLNHQYKERMKFVNSAILQLNLKSGNGTDNLILLCINAFILCSKNEITISSDDVKFIKYVIEDYFSKKIISPCMLFEASDLIEKEINRISNKNELNIKQLNSLYNCLFFCQQNFIANLKSKVSLEDNRIYTLFLKYKEKPKISATDILNELSPQSNFKAKLLKTQTGSFLEWIQSDGNAIVAFGFFMDFLGITVPIIYDLIKEKHKKKKESKKSNELSISITNYINTINNTATTQKLPNVITTVNINNMNVANSFKGYNKQNLIEVKVVTNID